jgi:hypothetical protein
MPSECLDFPGAGGEVSGHVQAFEAEFCPPPIATSEPVKR